MMFYPSLLAAALLALYAAAISAASLDTIRTTVDRGEYSVARQLIDERLAAQPGADEARKLAFERERMRRIEMDFTLDVPGLEQSVRRYLPQASRDEIASWEQAGLLEYKVIDGQRRYFRKAAYNLMHIAPEIARRSPEYRRFAEEAALYRPAAHHEEVMRGPDPVRNRFEVTYTLTVEADAVPAGETVRAWLPFPKRIPGRQENVALLQASPGAQPLPTAEPAQHTLYFERVAVAGEPTEFSLRYAWDSLSAYHRISAAEVGPLPRDPALAPHLAERPPHVVFSETLRQLSARIVGMERNPWRIAQKLFARVDEIPWAGAREYSTIRNISHYAATAGHADCGQQTLLLITLLRMNGIPARWQSGWEFSPDGFDTMHDWGEFYLAPYGWMPMDVTHGRLGGAADPRHWFYLGGIDAYRLVFNTDYGRPLVPARQHWRSETVDSQRGEVEWSGGNLYFDQWDYDLQWRRLPVAAAEATR